MFVCVVCIYYLLTPNSICLMVGLTKTIWSKISSDFVFIAPKWNHSFRVYSDKNYCSSDSNTISIAFEFWVDSCFFFFFAFLFCCHFCHLPTTIYMCSVAIYFFFSIYLQPLITFNIFKYLVHNNGKWFLFVASSMGKYCLLLNAYCADKIH